MLMPLAFGAVIGAVMGLTGAGGGILAVPALVVGLGFSMQEAAPIALLSVAVAAWIGTAQALSAGHARYRAATVMALAGLPLSGLGALLAHELPQRALMLVFAAIMFVSAGRALLQRRQAASGAPARPARLDPATGRFVWTRPTLTTIAGIGALTGFMTGLLGVGGGFVMVPTLRRFTPLTMHGVVGTSLMVQALVASGTVTVALARGAALPWSQGLVFTSGTVAGLVAGRLLNRRWSAARLETAFTVLVVVVALLMVGKALAL
ncbi:sulfite exporter TauE/SafE family protein [Derxia gummosa]|uniref:Probable membrane transporter protein n=1 Tax=Derxia gummosa DSM 723 TaxID=1121388 RepID=A0A8B6X3Y8_9BURK|nr:sulfite exporter TauE/SafE family protein [Derxia gummosa]